MVEFWIYFLCLDVGLDDMKRTKDKIQGLQTFLNH